MTRRANARCLLTALVATSLAACGQCGDKRARDSTTSSDHIGTQAGPSGTDHTARTSPVSSSEPLAERVLIGNITIEVSEPEDSPRAPLDTRRLGRDLGRLLSSSPYFTPRPEDIATDHHARRADIEVALVYRVDLLQAPQAGQPAEIDQASQAADPAVGSITVYLEARVVWQDSPDAPDPGVAPRSSVALERQLLASEQDRWQAIVADFLAEVLAGVGHDLIAKEQMRVGGAPALESGLASDESGLVIYALDLVRERRSSDFFDAALAHLRSEESGVRDHALRALVAIGDPRAVDALAKRADFSDHAFMSDVLHAVTALGGDDARAYLEFVASGHPDEDLRTIARDGLERLPRTERE